jgi:hypothetical protein
MLPLLVLACTSGGPEPQSFELAELAPTFEAHAGFEHQPERKRLVPPKPTPKPYSGRPQLEVVARNDVTPEHDGLCPYDVEHRGFPAISEDGTTLVQAYEFIPNNADELDSKLELTWLDAAEVRIELVYDPSEDEAADAPGCDVLAVRMRKKVAAINEELDAHSWRRLEPLDVDFSELSDNDRPLEVFYHQGHFIGRIRGVRVLQDTPRPEWRLLGDRTEFCGRDAQISAIDFDPATRLALVHYNYGTGSCLCDERSHFGRIELSPELLAAAERS